MIRLREERDGYKSACAQLSQQLEELERYLDQQLKRND